MKKTVLTTILILGMSAGTALAQETMPMDMGYGRAMQQGRGMMMGPGPGPGMMMNRDDMGPAMMGGRGMMMQGRHGCLEMMGPGMGPGMGHGMMAGRMMNRMSAENQQRFMDDTVELRKEMHTLRFAYMEAMRNPDTRLAELADMEQQMLDIRKDMLRKAEKYQDMNR
ncbi:MAG: hypothetical protein C0613_13740 [Desulfobulbaceae bacterium]|nr:MAG: hypothetical protein C0613_13740 [Desulfobulbaceae bacterium]